MQLSDLARKWQVILPLLDPYRYKGIHLQCIRHFHIDMDHTGYIRIHHQGNHLSTCSWKSQAPFSHRRHLGHMEMNHMSQFLEIEVEKLRILIHMFNHMGQVLEIEVKKLRIIIHMFSKNLYIIYYFIS